MTCNCTGACRVPPYRCGGEWAPAPLPEGVIKALGNYMLARHGLPPLDLDDNAGIPTG